MKNKKGFTLTEIVATLVILGVLLLIAIPTYSHFTKKFEKEYYDAKVKTISQSAKTYFQDHKIELESDELYTNVVSLEKLIEDKYVDSNIEKGYRSNGKIDTENSYVVSIKTPEDYVEATCLYDNDNKSYFSKNAKDKVKFKGGMVTDLCNNEWKKNDGIFNYTLDNDVIKDKRNVKDGSTDSSENDIYVFYDGNINSQILREQLGTYKTTEKLEIVNKEDKTLGQVLDCEKKFYPENYTSINFDKINNGNAGYNLLYKEGNDLATVKVYFYTHKGPIVSIDNAEEDTLYLDQSQKGKIIINNTDDSYSHYEDYKYEWKYYDNNEKKYKKLICEENENISECTFNGTSFIDNNVKFKVIASRSLNSCESDKTIQEESKVSTFLIKKDSSKLQVNPNGGSVKIDNNIYNNTKDIIKGNEKNTTILKPIKDTEEGIDKTFKVTFETISDIYTSNKKFKKTYSFINWSQSGNLCNNLECVSGDCTFKHSYEGSCYIEANYSSSVSYSTDKIKCPKYTKSVSSGYKFVGWEDEKSNLICVAEEEITPSSDLNLKPKILKNSSILVIDPNGGSVKIDEVSYNVRTSFEREGEDTISYSKPIKSDSTEKVVNYKVSFQNGSSIKEFTSYKTSDYSYTFNSWSTMNCNNGTFSSLTGAGFYTYPSSGSCEMVATYNKTLKSTKTDKIICPKIDSVSGKKVEGWYTGTNGTGDFGCYSEGDYLLSKDATLYPYLSDNTSSLKIVPNGTYYTLNGTSYNDSEKTITKTLGQTSTISKPQKSQKNIYTGQLDIYFYDTGDEIEPDTYISYLYSNFSWIKTGNCGNLDGTTYYHSTTGTCTLTANYSTTTSNIYSSVQCPSIPSKSGYTASGWYNSTGVFRCESNSSYTPTSSETLYAKYVENARYSVSYNANGGSYPPPTQTVEAGKSIKISTSIPIRTDYNFAYWMTNSGNIIYAGQSYTPTSNVTLYAQWTYSPSTYTVSYDANGGSGAPSGATVNAGSNYTISSTIPYRNDYTFNGWNTRSDGYGDTYYSGSTYTINNNLTLYAQWTYTPEPPCYQIYFDKNGGSGGTNYIYEKYGVGLYSDSSCSYPVSSVSIPSRSGYTFNGYYNEWQYITSSGDFHVNMTNNGNYKAFSDDTTLTAKWTQNATKPTLSVQYSLSSDFSSTYSGGWTNSNVYRRLYVNSSAGVSAVQYTTNTSYCGTNSGNGTNETIISSSGNYYQIPTISWETSDTACFRVKDNNGYWSNWSSAYTAKVDKTAPSFSLVFKKIGHVMANDSNYDSYGTSSSTLSNGGSYDGGTILAYITGSDSGSGIKKITCSPEAGYGDAKRNSSSFNLPNKNDGYTNYRNLAYNGITYIDCSGSDNAGNSFSSTYYVDNTHDHYFGSSISTSKSGYPFLNYTKSTYSNSSCWQWTDSTCGHTHYAKPGKTIAKRTCMICGETAESIDNNTYNAFWCPSNTNSKISGFGAYTGTCS